MQAWFEKWRRLSAADRFRVGFMLFMQVAFIAAFFLSLYERAWLTSFVAAVALLVVWLPSFLERSFQTHVPLEFELLLNIFIYGSIFLGEMQGFYTRFWWWDLVLHGGSGIALGFLGFLILFSLYRTERLDMRPSLLALFSFCFALALGVLWEIFEFLMDSAFGFSMQKSGLLDTMSDLIVNTIGAGIAAASGYFYMRYRWRGIGLFEHFLNAYFSDRNRK